VVSAVSPDAPAKMPVDDLPGADAPADTIRRAHVNRETSLRAMCLLYSLIGSVVLLATVFVLTTGSDVPLEVRPGIYGAIDVLVYVVGATAFLVVAYGLWQPRRWARIAAIVLSTVGLMAIPIGTLLCPYFLYLLLSAKGRRVFAPDYAAIVAATPHIKHRTSIIVWTLLAVFLAIAALVVVRGLIVR
jgi:hypothetical protein